MGKFPAQTPLGARPGFGTQPRYEAPGELQVEISNEYAVINIRLVRLPFWQWPKVDRGAAKQQLKNKEVIIPVFFESKRKFVENFNTMKYTDNKEFWKINKCFFVTTQKSMIKNTLAKYHKTISNNKIYRTLHRKFY